MGGESKTRRKNPMRIIDTFWKVALGAFFTALTVLVLQFSHVLVGWQATADGMGTEVHIAAKATVLAGDKIFKEVSGLRTDLTNVSDDLRASVNGQLLIMNSTVGHSAAAVADAAGALVGGDKGRNGLLDLTDSLTNTSNKIGQLTEETADVESRLNQQFLNCVNGNEGNPGCLQSRWLALSGELMKTMDSTRRTAKTIELATPEMLRQTTGVVTDIHAVTNRYVHPTKKDLAKSALFDVAKLCVILCR